MAGQNIERRDALRMLSLASAASAFPGFVRWCFAFSPAQTQIKPADYSPQFFTAEEYSLLERLTELIIPTDETPGAREAGVSEFIDFMVASDTPLQYRFRYGLLWLDTHSRSLHSRPFLEVTPEQQHAILEALAYTDRHQPGQEDGRAFFRLLRDYTVMGFYTTRIGYEELDVPGLRTYSDSPECPHTDDPEHRHL